MLVVGVERSVAVLVVSVVVGGVVVFVAVVVVRSEVRASNCWVDSRPKPFQCTSDSRNGSRQGRSQNDAHLRFEGGGCEVGVEFGSEGIRV